MGTVAMNQREVLHALTRARTGLSVGAWQEIAVDQLAGLFHRLGRRPSLIHRFSQRARQVVDSNGAYRVAALMIPDHVSLRPATMDDAALALNWRNAESTRAYSFDRSVLDAQHHRSWWANSFAMGQRDLLVPMIDTTAVGILRLDRSGMDATISIYLDPGLIGLGIGTLMLRSATKWVRQWRALTHRPIANVMAENVASQAAFRKAGFHEDAGGRWVFLLTA